MSNLENIFKNLLNKYLDVSVIDDEDVEELWEEMLHFYNKTDRYYHNLRHIENVVNELETVKNKINDYDTVLFAAFYHDFIYFVEKEKKISIGGNEKRNAIIAESTLKKILYPLNKVAECQEHIIATKYHEKTLNNDTNFLIDADLSILGQKPDIYNEYCKNIRKEYSIFSDNKFYLSRKILLEKILSKENIFTTQHFIDLYEKQARINIKDEIEKLKLKLT